jgi:crotonobetainyl-CoA:carnitine CoA-transferase CaiB-like acyl-CoA transferase
MVSPASGALAGIRVLDLSRVLAGPYCTQMLADHGADVIKVEPPGGDETRGWGPPFIRPGTSAYYQALNRNKRNIVLDLRSAAGRDVVRRLLPTVDVLVENYKAGTLGKWGFADEDLSEDFPRLIHCRITGYGTDGPLGGAPGYEAVLQAYAGLLSVNENRAVGARRSRRRTAGAWRAVRAGPQRRGGPHRRPGPAPRDGHQPGRLPRSRHSRQAVAHSGLGTHDSA